MTEPQDKRCGPCGWAAPGNRPKCVECDWIFHHATPLVLNYHQTYIYETEGRDCPCWEPKQAAPSEKAGQEPSRHPVDILKEVVPNLDPELEKHLRDYADELVPDPGK